MCACGGRARISDAVCVGAVVVVEGETPPASLPVREVSVGMKELGEFRLRKAFGQPQS